ncbi:MAG: hypothetical protein ACKV19_14280 [Verrucomicrobiales bacterium]
MATHLLDGTALDLDDDDGIEDENDGSFPRALRWDVCLCERDANGGWHPVGQPIKEDLASFAVAVECAEGQNRREFGPHVWAGNPKRAWLARARK